MALEQRDVDRRGTIRRILTWPRRDLAYIRAEVDAEIAFHLEMRVRELVEQGRSVDAAGEQAEREFGNIAEARKDLMASDMREHRWRHWSDVAGDAVRDFRFAARGLARAPLFTAAAVAILGLGLGATTAMFAVIDGVVLRPLPYEEADRLVYIDSPVPSEGENTVWGVSEAGYFYVQDHNRTLAGLGAYGAPGTDAEFTVVGPEGGRRVKGIWATASLLRVLRGRAAIGRLFGKEDERRGVPNVVVLGYEFWQREYGADAGVIGKVLELEGGWKVQVIGVLERGFRSPDGQVDVWVPLGLDPTRPADRFHGFQVIGRLMPGITVDDAARDLARLTAQFPEAMPEVYSETFMQESGFQTRATPLHALVLGELGRVLWILFGSVSILLLIACTNVANLFLVRGEARRRDRAIQIALGTSRLRLAREAWAESLLLTAGAAAVGVCLAEGVVRLLPAIAPPNLPRLDEVSIAGRSIAMAIGIALTIGVAFGYFPLLRNSSDMSVLRTAGRGMTLSKHRHTVRRTMVVAQMALALVLLAGAGLMLRSFERLRDVRPGLDPRNVLTVDVFLPEMHDGYSSPALVQGFYRNLIDRIGQLPGVLETGAGGVPLKDRPRCFATYVEDRSLARGEEPPCIDLYTVTPGLLPALRIPVRGQEPNWARVEDPEAWARREVVVTHALAERLWPGEDPIGKGIRQGDPGPPYARVVGVTDDVRANGLDRAPANAIFGQAVWDRGLSLVLRTQTAQPELLTAAVRRTVFELERSAAMGRVQTMEQVIATSPSMARASFIMTLLAAGAAMGLLLSAVGLFGLLAYLVGQQRSEIGIRMALGARSHDVATMVMRHSLKLVLAGTGVGLLTTWATSRMLRLLLFQVNPTDPFTLAAVTGILILVALVATYFPARRAARVDPMIALRAE